MNQERFDELSKALATNRLSRVQVLKGVAASLLLVGPLGALWNRTASAATCPNCGTCTAVNIDTVSGTVKQARCEGSLECSARVLCREANQRARYLQLERYLRNAGFKATITPRAFIVRQNGKLVRRALGTYYANSALGQNATLTYAKEASGKTAAWAVVAEGNLVKYSLGFDGDGKIVRGLPPEGQPPTGATDSVTGKYTGAASDVAVVESMGTDGDADAEAFNPQSCNMKCTWLCSAASTTVCALLLSSVICPATIIGTPAAVAACAWTFRIGCSLLGGSACRKYCGENACQCPNGRQACGNECLGTCQSCVDGQAKAKQCDSTCETCLPYTNRCEVVKSRLCDGVCCAEGLSCRNGLCLPPDKYFCNCNDTCYDDVEVCRSECEVTLGCFTGICGPAEPGQCPV